MAVLALGLGILLAYAHPGMMSMDSIEQLREARRGLYTDGHPPAMSVLWRFVEHLYTGPLGMLLIQATAFLAGLYIVLRRALRPIAAACATTAILVFPPVFTPLAVIWKDCLMAGFLVLATAGLTSPHRNARLAGLLACIAACMIRYNAPAATLPLIVILFTWSPMPALRRYALAVAVWLATTVTALGIGMALTDRPIHIWHASLALYDIAGTLAHVDESIPDAELRKTLAGTQLRADQDIHATVRRIYSPSEYFGIISGETRLWDVPLDGETDTPAAQREAISRAYTTIITEHPVAYLVHRASVMRHVLALTNRQPYSPVMTHRLQFATILAEYGVPAEPSPLQWRWEKRLSHLAAFHVPALFRPWIYLVLALALLPFCRGQRDVFAILLSGIGLEASLFLLAASPDYRYSHWLVVCTCIAIVMLVARRMDSGHNRPRGERS